MNKKRYYVILPSLLLFNAILLIPLSDSYAQQDQGLEIKPIRVSTKSLDIEISLNSVPEPNKEVNMQITFFTKETNTIQQHVDYIITIKDNNGNIIDRIPPEPQPILHTDAGRITVPYTFKSEGNYKISIDVKGILFIPIPTETAEFNITVVPEFPPTVVLVTLAALIALYIMLVRSKVYSIFIAK